MLCFYLPHFAALLLPQFLFIATIAAVVGCHIACTFSRLSSNHVRLTALISNWLAHFHFYLRTHARIFVCSHLPRRAEMSLSSRSAVQTAAILLHKLRHSFKASHSFLLTIYAGARASLLCRSSPLHASCHSAPHHLFISQHLSHVAACLARCCQINRMYAFKLCHTHTHMRVNVRI